MDGMGGWEQRGGDGELGIINQSILARVGGWGAARAAELQLCAQAR